MSLVKLSSPVLFLLVLGCDGRSVDTGDQADTDTDTDTDTDSDTDTDTDTDTGSTSGWTVSGMAVDFAAQLPAAEGLTVAFADPMPALTGGELDILGTGTTAADGTYSIGGIEGNPSLGAFLVVTGGDNMATATGVASTSYAGFGDGDALTGASAYVISGAMAAGIDASLAPLGVSDSVTTTGVLFVNVRDAAGNPVDGAVVSDGDCGQTVYYMDADSDDDGLFITAGVPNTATSAAAGGFAVIPAGAICTYEADAAGKTGSQLSGSLAGLAVFTGITVE